jgi:hypothetical protein
MVQIDPLIKFETEKAFGPIPYRPYKVDGVRIILSMLFKKQVQRLGLTISELTEIVDKDGVIDSIDDLSLFFQVLLCMK